MRMENNIKDVSFSPPDTILLCWFYCCRVTLKKSDLRFLWRIWTRHN
jgi:hypothetical protein